MFLFALILDHCSVEEVDAWSMCLCIRQWVLYHVLLIKRQLYPIFVSVQCRCTLYLRWPWCTLFTSCLMHFHKIIELKSNIIQSSDRVLIPFRSIRSLLWNKLSVHLFCFTQAKNLIKSFYLHYNWLHFNSSSHKSTYRFYI